MPTEQEWIAARDSGMTIKQAAESLGVSYSAAWREVSEIGVKFRHGALKPERRRNKTPEQIELDMRAIMRAMWSHSAQRATLRMGCELRAAVPSVNEAAQMRGFKAGFIARTSIDEGKRSFKAYTLTAAGVAEVLADRAAIAALRHLVRKDGSPRALTDGDLRRFGGEDAVAAMPEAVKRKLAAASLVQGQRVYDITERGLGVLK